MEFREVHQQSLTEMEELRKFQSSTFDTIARRKLIEDQNTILELSGESLWAVASKPRQRTQGDITWLWSHARPLRSRARSWSTKFRTRVVRRTRVTRHQHSRGGKERHNPRAGRSQSADGRQEVQSWIGHEPAKLFQIITKTVQRKNPIIQRSESGDRADHDSPDSVCRETRSTRCKDRWSCHRCSTSTVPDRRYSRSLKFHSNSTWTLKCQQRCNAQRYNARTPPDGTTGSIPWTGRSEHREDARVQRQVEMIQKMPSDLFGWYPEHFDARFQRNSTAIAMSSVADLEQKSLRCERVRRLHQTWRRTCLSRGVPADHEARRQNSEMRGRPHSHARDTAEQEEGTQQIASVIENFTPFAEAVTQRSWANRPDRKNTISDMLLFSRVWGRDENPHFMRVDTASEQRDRHCSRARERRSSMRKRNGSSSPGERIVVNDVSVERVHLPWNKPSRSGAMLSCGVGIVNYHKVTLEESETEPQPKSQW